MHVPPRANPKEHGSIGYTAMRNGQHHVVSDGIKLEGHIPDPGPRETQFALGLNLGDLTSGPRLL